MSSQTARKIQKIIVYIILAIGAVTMIIPFYWMIATSLKTQGESIAMPPVWWPDNPQWSNYIEAWNAAPFGRYFLNSVITTTISTLGELLTTILAAFAFARLQFFGKNVLFAILIATMMIPGELLTIPNFLTLSRFELTNTLVAIFLPYLASVFSVYILKETFESIPDQLYYAAKIDGASNWYYLWRIMVPMSKSAIVSIALLKIVGSWNAFMWPLIVTNTTELRTLPVGLQAFTTEAGTQYSLLMAASTIVILPMVIIYLFLQRYIIQGISRGGVKG